MKRRSKRRKAAIRKIKGDFRRTSREFLAIDFTLSKHEKIIRALLVFPLISGFLIGKSISWWSVVDLVLVLVVIASCEYEFFSRRAEKNRHYAFMLQLFSLTIFAWSVGDIKGIVMLLMVALIYPFSPLDSPLLNRAIGGFDFRLTLYLIRMSLLGVIGGYLSQRQINFELSLLGLIPGVMMVGYFLVSQGIKKYPSKDYND
jgi:hypothetical protein